MYYTGLEYLTPGRPFAEFMDIINTFGEKRGMKSQLLMHGRGYGDDGPLFTPQNRGVRNRDVRIEKGNVFIVKPIAHSADGTFDTSWGGCVLSRKKAASRWSNARRVWCRLPKDQGLSVLDLGFINRQWSRIFGILDAFILYAD